MNNLLDQLQQILNKTAQVALHRSTAAVMPHVQDQRGTSPFAGTNCLNTASATIGTLLIEPCPATGGSVKDKSNTEAALSGAGFLRDIVQELIRLNSRVLKSLTDCVSASFCCSSTIHPRRSAPDWLHHSRGRLQTALIPAMIHSLQDKSVSSATEEEYAFRRETTRQRVFHEKGNAD